jgi:hypothetical protein
LGLLGVVGVVRGFVVRVVFDVCMTLKATRIDASGVK